MPAQNGTSSLDGVRGVAALLLAMEKDDANRLLGKFVEEEIERIVVSAAELGKIANNDLGGLIDLFERDLTQTPDLVGSEAEAELLIEGAVSQEAADRILASLRGDLPPVELWSRLPEFSAPRIAETLNREHPQVIAFALSRFESEQAAEVIALFDPSMRQSIFDLMLDIGEVKESSIQLLECHLAKELLTTAADGEDSGMHVQMAGIMNRLDRSEVDELLTHFDAIRPKAARALRGLIFSFEDIVKLSETERKSLFESVPAERVILALRNAPEELTQAALSSLTGRNRRMVEMELESGAEVPTEDINDAQRWIADLVVGMVQDGAIRLLDDDENDEV